MLKRQMYGRAGFDLLRKRILSATDTFRTDHGKWARTTFQPSFTLKNKVTLFPGVIFR